MSMTRMPSPLVDFKKSSGSVRSIGRTSAGMEKLFPLPDRGQMALARWSPVVMSSTVAFRILRRFRVQRWRLEQALSAAGEEWRKSSTVFIQIDSSCFFYAVLWYHIFDIFMQSSHIVLCLFLANFVSLKKTIKNT